MFIKRLCWFSKILLEHQYPPPYMHTHILRRRTHALSPKVSQNLERQSTMHTANSNTWALDMLSLSFSSFSYFLPFLLFLLRLLSLPFLSFLPFLLFLCLLFLRLLFIFFFVFFFLLHRTKNRRRGVSTYPPTLYPGSRKQLWSRSSRRCSAQSPCSGPGCWTLYSSAHKSAWSCRPSPGWRGSSSRRRGDAALRVRS